MMFCYSFLAAMSHDQSVIGKYRAGFTECTREVTRYLNTISNVSDDVKMRMMSHLSSYVTGIENSAPRQSTNVTGQYIQVQPVQMQTQSYIQPQQYIQQPQCVQQQQYVQQQQCIQQQQQFVQAAATPQYVSNTNNTVQLIPGTLPNGQVAYFVPNVTNCSNILAANVAPAVQQPQMVSVLATPNTSVAFTNQRIATPQKASEAPMMQMSPVTKGGYQVIAPMKATVVASAEVGSLAAKDVHPNGTTTTGTNLTALQVKQVTKGEIQGAQSMQMSGVSHKEASVLKEAEVDTNPCYSYDALDGNYQGYLNGNVSYQDGQYSPNIHVQGAPQEGHVLPVEQVWRPW